MKRILDCQASDFMKMSKEELKLAIQAGEGRTICSEIFVTRQVQEGVCNAEVAKAFGADLILLNGLDLFRPQLAGFEFKDEQSFVSDLKKISGRPVGVNLEPIDLEAEMLETRENLIEGRVCSLDTVKKAEQMGFDFICLTGNPGTGVTHRSIARSVEMVKKHFSGLLVAGKMHGSGSEESVIPDFAQIEHYLNSGVDVILLPAVGTVPGLTVESLQKTIAYIHQKQGLALTAIGTSQEGSGREVIEEIALMNKMAGADIQHIGDAAYSGIADVENIYALSKAIRGIRHTIVAMSKSIHR